MSFKFLILIGAFLFYRFYKAITRYLGMCFLPVLCIIHSPSKEMAWVGQMLVKGLSGSIEDNGDEAVKAAEAMIEDIDDVMQGLAKDMSTALPTNLDIDGSVGGAIIRHLTAASCSVRHRRLSRR